SRYTRPRRLSPLFPYTTLFRSLQWFIENPFQNWTRHNAAILGTVMLWVDYTLPLQPLRAEAQRLADGSPDWDRRVCEVQVVDTRDRKSTRLNSSHQIISYAVFS